MQAKEQFQVDVWTRLMEDRAKELQREGLSKEEAEDRALSEIRRQIRNS